MKKTKNRIPVIALIAVVAVACGILLQNNYYALLLCYVCIYGMAATGLDILFGYTGQISMGQAGFFAIGAYTSALLAKAGVPVLIAILCACILSTIFGVIIAFPAVKLVKHFLAVLMISFGQIVYTFVNVTADLTGGSSGLKGIPTITFFGFSFDTNKQYFFLLVVLFALVLVFKNRLVKSRVGTAFIAIRENTFAAAGMGINVVKYKTIAFAVAAFLAGFAGALYAHLSAFISPETFNATQSVLFMTMLLFGGMASLWGPVIGTVILLFIKELLQNFASAQVLIYALFIILVLFFLPSGVIGIIDNIKAKLKKAEGRGTVNAQT